MAVVVGPVVGGAALIVLIIAVVVLGKRWLKRGTSASGRMQATAVASRGLVAPTSCPGGWKGVLRAGCGVREGARCCNQRCCCCCSNYSSSFPLPLLDMQHGGLGMVGVTHHLPVKVS